MPQYISSSIVRARKNHFCSECYSIIESGKEYERRVLVYDGRIYTWKRCEPCIKGACINYAIADGYGDDYVGATADDIYEWALEAAVWHPKEVWRQAAREYLARARHRVIDYDY